jgi:hypothetical protein
MELNHLETFFSALGRRTAHFHHVMDFSGAFLRKGDKKWREKENS